MRKLLVCASALALLATSLVADAEAGRKRKKVYTGTVCEASTCEPGDDGIHFRKVVKTVNGERKVFGKGPKEVVTDPGTYTFDGQVTTRTRKNNGEVNTRTAHRHGTFTRQ